MQSEAASDWAANRVFLSVVHADLLKPLFTDAGGMPHDERLDSIGSDSAGRANALGENSDVMVSAAEHAGFTAARTP
jgi:hypothetical protein